LISSILLLRQELFNQSSFYLGGVLFIYPAST